MPRPGSATYSTQPTRILPSLRAPVAASAGRAREPPRRRARQGHQHEQRRPGADRSGTRRLDDQAVDSGRDVEGGPGSVGATRPSGPARLHRVPGHDVGLQEAVDRGVNPHRRRATGRLARARRRPPARGRSPAPPAHRPPPAPRAPPAPGRRPHRAVSPRRTADPSREPRRPPPHQQPPRFRRRREHRHCAARRASRRTRGSLSRPRATTAPRRPRAGTPSTISALAPTTMSENSAKASRAARLPAASPGKRHGRPARPVRDSRPAGRSTGTTTTLPISAAGSRLAASLRGRARRRRLDAAHARRRR